ncbi:FadR/GntR family transcriptional regulator [Streptomyces spectabilis]|uniref:FadR family transcriptional regulator n=1 Tax=Streptomyces spectabilis TaxID=68270 RepID=A0A5P2XCW2_STRST|nr:FCD domain-containing protein [Streptomyces spectabilis]MBB5104371.1 DNA-binding FadR family transcriptional regulator [Streptomyces spectabilis]QEV62278.1 FadR family transcriptional regulator [Streptomyces spectabilis]GGU99549.1 GntR family transcriptional regulator [Streptomyces spectabilis]
MTPAKPSAPQLGALRPSPLVEQATERLRDQITGGGWPVGAKLPGETTLAKELGVGRSTVREALRALAGAGLVQARQGAGVFVTATEPVEDWPARLRAAAIGDVYEVRALVEVQAARLAAVRRTPEDIAAMRGALAARRRAAGGGDAAFVDADIALHATVVAAAHNPVLTDLFAQFVPALRQGLIDLLDLIDVRREESDHGDEAHEALVRAVESGDGDAAERVARAELEVTLGRLVDRG